MIQIICKRNSTLLTFPTRQQKEREDEKEDEQTLPENFNYVKTL